MSLFRAIAIASALSSGVTVGCTASQPRVAQEAEVGFDGGGSAGSDSATDAQPVASEPRDATLDGALSDSDGRGGDAGDAVLQCSSCQDRNLLVVHILSENRCLELRLGPTNYGVEGCSGLGLGAGDLCLMQARSTRAVSSCPPDDQVPSTTAVRAEGSVVGHDGALYISVELEFPSDGGTVDRAQVDIDHCHSVTSLAPPCE